MRHHEYCLIYDLNVDCPSKQQVVSVNLKSSLQPRYNKKESGFIHTLLYANLPPTPTASSGALSRHRHKRPASEPQYSLWAAHPDPPLDSGRKYEEHLEAI